MCRTVPAREIDQHPRASPDRRRVPSGVGRRARQTPRGRVHGAEKLLEDTLDARSASLPYPSAKPLLRRAASGSSANRRAGWGSPFPTATRSGASARRSPSKRVVMRARAPERMKRSGKGSFLGGEIGRDAGDSVATRQGSGERQTGGCARISSTSPMPLVVFWSPPLAHRLAMPGMIPRVFSLLVRRQMALRGCGGPQRVASRLPGSHRDGAGSRMPCPLRGLVGVAGYAAHLTEIATGKPARLRAGRNGLGERVRGVVAL